VKLRRVVAKKKIEPQDIAGTPNVPLAPIDTFTNEAALESATVTIELDAVTAEKLKELAGNLGEIAGKTVSDSEVVMRGLKTQARPLNLSSSHALPRSRRFGPSPWS
jgi:hypothetical protein